MPPIPVLAFVDYVPTAPMDLWLVACHWWDENCRRARPTLALLTADQSQSTMPLAAQVTVIVPADPLGVACVSRADVLPRRTAADLAQGRNPAGLPLSGQPALHLLNLGHSLARLAQLVKMGTPSADALDAVRFAVEPWRVEFTTGVPCPAPSHPLQAPLWLLTRPGSIR